MTCEKLSFLKVILTRKAMGRMSKEESVVYDNQREGRTQRHKRHNRQSVTGEHSNRKTTSLQRSPTGVSRHREWPLNLKMGQKETE